MTVDQELRQRLERELARTGWTQARLARKSGVSRPAISHLLCGDRDGRIATWQRLFDTIAKVADHDPKCPLR